MALKTNEFGYTLYKLLFILAIIAICLPLQIAILKSLQLPASYEEISIQQFFHFIQQDVIKAEGVQLANDKIILELDGDLVTIEEYGRLIRRQVNRQGHEIYLRDIGNMTISPLPYGFTIGISSLQGEIYEKDIVFYP
ncbi:competence type IV pilus minor pilin ComGF [Ornithinibacillus contaminans]|uniref:competence type IV pilus minor pilin ComGF n=1 Tax=Ornithinibacillus contaminans TaxID=694055 RepID=UPI00064DE45A|nr:ComGF family competence protein [Ornithinibacillus contaminans]